MLVFVLFVVGAHVVRTLDFINDLHTQLFHNRLSLVMLDRRNPRQTGNIAGIKAAGGDLFLQKESRKKKSKKMTTNQIKM